MRLQLAKPNIMTIGRLVCGLVCIVLVGCTPTNVPQPGDPCTVDDDCADGIFCNGVERCLDDACTIGVAPCTAGAESACHESFEVCLLPGQTPCAIDSQCSAFEACDGAQSACESRNRSCTSDANCSLLEVCDTSVGRCAQLGATCQSDSDCTSTESCNSQNRCVSQPTGCSNNADCASGESCNTSTGECIASDSSCTSDADCPTGQSCDPATHACAANGECVTDLDCNAGESCDPIARVCEAETVRCNNNTQCAPDGRCDLTSGVCVPANSCNFNTDCPLGQACDSDRHLCVPAI